MSSPLQRGVRLLRRLRPLSRVLAFSHPFQVKRYQSPQFRVNVLSRSVAACFTPGVRVRYPSLICEQRGTDTFPFGPSVSAISLVQVYDASDTGFFRQHRSQE
jgi:hypothetical protein